MSWLPLLKKLAPGLVGLALLATAFAGGWLVNGWRLGEELATYRQELAEAAAAEVQAAQDETRERQRQLEALDARYTQEMADAQAEIDRLADDVADGRRRLRLNAECPGERSGTSSAAGGPDAAAPRLTAAAERDYLRLRRGIEAVTAQVRGLQEYIRTQCIAAGGTND